MFGPKTYNRPRLVRTFARRHAVFAVDCDAVGMSPDIKTWVLIALLLLLMLVRFPLLSRFTGADMKGQVCLY